ncbi:MAG: phospho-sugar mutase [Bacteriovoracaceae bacterium]|nr:phospho-sugar mutase [Bacteriovoracaceae bacterium]
MERHVALERAQEWAKNEYFSLESRKEIQDLIDAGDEAELYERFYKEMEFGTGGIRGILGQGINRLNYYTVRKATQALAYELKNSFKGDIKVALSYDSRNFSKEFAEETAGVLAGNGIQSYIYNRLNPVCLLSWSTREHKAQAGIMITASHNPPKYNGYKVYWDDGRQITSPNDKNIINNYCNIKDYNEIGFMSFQDGLDKGLIHYVGEEVEDNYIDMIAKYAIKPDMIKENGDKVKIIFTPIHGTGLVPVQKIFKKLGFTNYSIVKEQELPDGNFPTVASPNPENPAALQLAVDLMKAQNGDIVLGTDPDADRIGIAVPHKDEVHYLNGNQIGTLLMNYVIEGKKELGNLPKRGYVAKTIVTTDLQQKIADAHGLEMFNTLTGFKWLGGVIGEKEKNDKDCEFIFASEESFGYLNHTHVRDKDGIGPSALLCEMVLSYKLQGKTLIDGLDDIYEQYGFFHEHLLNLSYEGSEGAKKIQKIMDLFRDYSKDVMAGEKIEAVEDYTNGFNGLPASNVLCFRLSGGNKVLMRPSGTEPKIKFYIMLQKSEGTLEENKVTCKALTDSVVKEIEEICKNA